MVLSSFLDESKVCKLASQLNTTCQNSKRSLGIDGKDATSMDTQELGEIHEVEPWGFRRDTWHLFDP